MPDIDLPSGVVELHEALPHVVRRANAKVSRFDDEAKDDESHERDAKS